MTITNRTNEIVSGNENKRVLVALTRRQADFSARNFSESDSAMNRRTAHLEAIERWLQRRHGAIALPQTLLWPPVERVSVSDERTPGWRAGYRNFDERDPRLLLLDEARR